MRQLATRMLLAVLGTTLGFRAMGAEDQLRYSGFEQRLAALESQMASSQNVQQAGYAKPEASSSSAEVCGPPSCGCDDRGGFYGEYEMLWIRPHVNEDFAGKLSEQHNYSYRWVLGYEDACGVGARVRYWRYDHAQDVLSGGDSVRFGMDVLDVEATDRFGFRRTDIVVGGGIRIADMELDDTAGDDASLDALGITLAADIRTRLCGYCCNTWSWVYGGRVAVLGGDWSGDNDFIDTVGTAEVRDDNLLVHELYAGLEYAYDFNGYDLYSRLTFEMQQWQSDVLGELSNTDSIGFIGPGIKLGANF